MMSTRSARRALALALATTLSAEAVAEEAPAPPLPGARIIDCAECPEMIVMGAGAYEIGSPADEPGRFKWEGPRQRVEIGPFAIGVREVTVAEYAAFVAATGRSDTGDCAAYADGAWIARPEYGWDAPAIAQAPDHPVVCVSWADAVDYAAWLSELTGERYRLPSEAEWEYVARAGGDAAYPWGASAAEGCAHANIADAAAAEAFPHWETIGCADGALYTGPVGGYPPNAFGVHDMIGNAMEWVGDCWRENYPAAEDAPWNGAAWRDRDPTCLYAVVRGGSWSATPAFLRSASRYFFPRWERYADIGFRLARDVAPAADAEPEADENAPAVKSDRSGAGKPLAPPL